MVERECGVIHGAMFGSLWEILPIEDGISRFVSLLYLRKKDIVALCVLKVIGYPTDRARAHRYQHVVTGRIENRTPSPLRGGILGDVGLRPLY